MTGTRQAPGKLRLLYEANPIGFLIEQAGGAASTGESPSSTSQPRDMHQRTAFVFGSRAEVERIEAYHRDHERPPLRRAAVRLARSVPHRGQVTGRCQSSHPIIAVTGSSGAGTTSVTRTFQQIFRREGINAAFVEGDAFHRFDRAEMARRMAEATEAGNHEVQPLRPRSQPVRGAGDAVPRLRRAGGTGRSRAYLHDDAEAAPYGQRPGTFTPWEDVPRRHRPPVLRGPARRRS